MLIGGIPSSYDGEEIQPNLPYVDGMVWDTNDQLSPGDVIEGMFLPNDPSDQIYDSYETIQLLDLEVHGRSGLGPTAPVPGSSLVPTPLPTSNQIDLSFVLGLEFGGSVVEADPHHTSEGEDTAMDFSPGSFDDILGAASPSSIGGSDSGSGSQRKVQKKPKKKEESGSCDECHRSFSRRSDARRHKITAHKKEAYGCPQCPVKCSRKDALLRHVRDQH